MKQRRLSTIISACLAASLLMSCIPAAAWANSPDAADQNSGITTLMGAPARQEISFNEDWKFQMGEVAGGEGTGLDDSGWRTVTLPHDYCPSMNYPKSTRKKCNSRNFARIAF